jgi:hypothetical protein
VAERRDRVVATLLERHGRTYATEAGIRLKDEPAPLFQLLCLSLLLSARIRSDIAVAAARALRDAGWTTPRRLAASSWGERAKVLSGAGYARYDERTSTQLGELADRLLDEYRGDLRGLRDRAGGDAGEVRRRLREFKGIGDVGVEIFCREAQAIWRELAPTVDERARRGAKSLGLPSSVRGVAGLVDPAELPRLVAALVRVTLDRDAAADVKAAARVGRT